MNSVPSQDSLSEKTHPSQATNWEWGVVLAIITLNVGLQLARLSQSEPLGSANDRSRWCTVWQLSARGTYQIDEIIQQPGWDTIDKVRHEGHFYSTKPPLYPTLLAGLYRCIRQVTHWSLMTETKEVTRLLLLLVNLIPFWIALYLFWFILRRFEFPPAVRLIALATLAWASLLNPYLIVLNNHSTAATALIVAIYAMTRVQADSSENAGNGKWYLLAGFFAAWTCCNELPAGLFGIAIFLISLKTDARKTWTLFVPAALVPLIAFFACNYVVTGSWKPFYLHYGTEKYVYEHLGIPSYWAEPRGIDQARDSVPTYIFHCLIGHHGIFSLTPMLLLLIPGLYWGAKRPQQWQRWWYIAATLITLGILAFYWKRTENYNYGGVSVSLRWTLWLIPFWILAIAESLRSFQFSSMKSLGIILLAIPSLFSTWEPWMTPWRQPWIFQAMETRGYIDYSDPLEQLPRSVNSWIYQLPASTELDPDYWIEYGVGSKRKLRIEDAGPVENAGRSQRKIVITEKFADHPETRRREFLLDPAGVAEGADPDTFLVSWTDTREGTQREEHVQLLRGLPGPREYRRSRQRYLFLPLREDAFSCYRMASRVETSSEIDGERESIRTDLWLSEELPFGLAQLRTATSSISLRQELDVEIWRVLGAGTILEKTELKARNDE